ncbi:hypothetical protein ABK040_011786 [Willaertia magna]
MVSNTRRNNEDNEGSSQQSSFQGFTFGHTQLSGQNASTINNLIQLPNVGSSQGSSHAPVQSTTRNTGSHTPTTVLGEVKQQFFKTSKKQQQHHESLDGKENKLLSKKELKKLNHQKFLQQQLEYSNNIKLLKKGKDFDIENNRNIKRKNEKQLEMDQLHFEMKSFLYQQATSSISNNNGKNNNNNGNSNNGNSVVDNYFTEMERKKMEKMMEEELINQGKSLQNKNKKEYLNYKELKLKIKENKQLEKKERQSQIRNGTLDLKKIKKEKYMEQQRKERETKKLFRKFGAPNEMGKSSHISKSKYGTGMSVGKWKNGILRISRKDVEKIKKNK